ncbi:MAG: CoA activase, partial [Halanaerobiaceae bacterium]
ADVLDEIYSTILALAENQDQAIKKFKESRNRLFQVLSEKSWNKIKDIMSKEAKKLSSIVLKEPYERAKKVALTGEIYVRSDKFSRQYIVEKLAEKDIVTKVASTNEWIYYVDYLLQNDLITPEPSLMEKMKNKMEGMYKRKVEKDIKGILSQSGLCEYKLTDIPEIIEPGKKVMDEELTGETILTIGGAIAEIIDEVDGIIAIGPFGCMPHRVSQSIITDKMEEIKNKMSENSSLNESVLNEFSSLPFLAIETDGNPFPQVIEARIEAFSLQVRRINDYINSYESSFKSVK